MLDLARDKKTVEFIVEPRLISKGRVLKKIKSYIPTGGIHRKLKSG